MKQLFTGCVAALFCLSLGVGVARPAAQAAGKDGAKKAGEATAEGAKKAGEATKEGTKKAADATKDGSKKAAETTKDAGAATADATKSATKATTTATSNAGKSIKGAFTGESTVICNDGKKHNGKTPQEACKDHGDIKH